MHTCFSRLICHLRKSANKINTAKFVFVTYLHYCVHVTVFLIYIHALNTCTSYVLKYTYMIGVHVFEI